MGDVYREILINKKMKKGEKRIIILLALGACICGAAIRFTVLAFLGMLLLGILAYRQLQMSKQEYEYLYVNGDLDVDRIIAKNRRKKAASYEMDHIELIAPYSSKELDTWKKQDRVRTIDFSSGEADRAVYAMIYHGSKGNEMVLLELDDTILKDLGRRIPRSVKLR